MECICLRPTCSGEMSFPGRSDSKESLCDVGYLGSIPGLGRSPGGGHGHPFQYSCLENPWTEEPGGLVYGVAKSQAQLSKYAITPWGDGMESGRRAAGRFGAVTGI